jgi:hypothetical protein
MGRIKVCHKGRKNLFFIPIFLGMQIFIYAKYMFQKFLLPIPTIRGNPKISICAFAGPKKKKK